LTSGLSPLVCLNRYAVHWTHAIRAARESSIRVCVPLALVGLLSTSVLAQPSDSTHQFEIPAQVANRALTELAQQAGIQGLFAFDEVNDVITNEVFGVYTVEEALELMLADANLEGEINEHGVLTVRLREVPEQRGASVSNNQQTGFFGRLGALLGIAAATSVPAQTQAQEDGASNLLEEIVVSARRREESLQDTPIAITALTGDYMDTMLIEDSRDLARFVPNLGAVSNGLAGGLGDNYVLRGIGTDRLFPDSESGVGIYIDDVFFPRVAANVVDIVELERVEVLRGPQGTLFGRNSMAGTMRYVTKKPTGQLGGNVKFTTGDLNRAGIKGSVDFPLGDNWSGLISIGQDRRDGYIIHELAPGTNGSKDNSTIRGKLRYENDRLTVDLGYTDTSTRSDGTPIVILSVSEPTDSRGYRPFVWGHNHAMLPTGPWDSSWASAGPYSIPGDLNEPDFNKMDQQVLEATVAYEISDSLIFRSITANTVLDYSWSMDMDESPLPVFTNSFSERDEVFQQEFQLLGESDRFNWQAGVFLYQEDPQYSQWTTAQVQESGSPRIRDQVYSTDAWAAFAQGNYALTDALTLTAGVRYTSEDKNVFSIFTLHSNPAVQGLQASNSASWDATTPMLSLAYRAQDNLMFYGSYSAGFRSGGINFNLYVGPNPEDIPNRGINPFDPEEAASFELGAKWHSENGNVIVNSALFSTDLDKQQLGGTIEFPGGFIGQQVNAGKSSMNGLEFEVLANVTGTFQLRATAAFFDGGFDEVGFAGATGLISPDSELPNSPESSYSLGGTVERPLANGGSLGFNFDYAWRDDIQSARNSANVLTLPALGLLNGSLKYYFPGDQLSISLAGTNLTDEYYFTFFRLRDVGAPFGSTNGIVGRPRELSLSADYRF